MTKHISHPLPTEHPEIVAIALDVMLDPARRVHYSALVLTLVDAAIERIQRELASTLPAAPMNAAAPQAGLLVAADPDQSRDQRNPCVDSEAAPTQSSPTCSRCVGIDP